MKIYKNKRIMIEYRGFRWLFVDGYDFGNENRSIYHILKVLCDNGAGQKDLLKIYNKCSIDITMSRMKRREDL